MHVVIIGAGIGGAVGELQADGVGRAVRKSSSEKRNDHEGVGAGTSAVA